MAVTIVLDDLDFADCPPLGAWKVRLHEDGEHVATIVVTRAMLQTAVAKAIGALETQQDRSATILAFSK